MPEFFIHDSQIINFQIPKVDESVKTFMPCGFLCCWQSGPLRVTARNPVGGYTPGQIINLTIKIENESNEKVTGVTAYLKQVNAIYYS